MHHSINQACICQELNPVAFIWLNGGIRMAQQPCYDQELQNIKQEREDSPVGKPEAYMSRWEVWPGNHRFVTESSIYFERMTFIASNKRCIRCSTTSLCMETEIRLTRELGISPVGKPVHIYHDGRYTHTFMHSSLNQAYFLKKIFIPFLQQTGYSHD